MLQTLLKTQLEYSPLTGEFIRLVQHRAVKIGDIAGCSDQTRNNAIRIGFNGKTYQAHQLAFLYMLGYIPKEIDHIDQDPTNNTWDNLREVTHKENGKNQKKRIDNLSGITGIRQRKNGKWRARIYIEGIHIDLGTFSEKSLAIQARLDALIKYAFHKNHGNLPNHATPKEIMELCKNGANTHN